MNLAIAFEDAKDAGLAIGATPTLAFDAARAEEAFINLDDTEQGSQFFAGGEDAFAQAAINAVERVRFTPVNSTVCSAARSAAKQRTIS